MLSHLYISNYALIENLDIDFPNGFISITGETGAGKSILLGAIGLLTGNRAENAALKVKDNKCIIEGTFEIKNYNLQNLFRKLDVDYDHQSIIRREITPSGKSRAFINDTPVALKDLKILGDKLMDIHSQFSTLHLADNSYQIALLDRYAGTNNELMQYHDALNQWRQAKQDLETLQEAGIRARREEDYLRFSLQQLSGIDLQKIKLQEIEEEKRILENSETVKMVLYNASETLLNSENAIITMLRSMQKEINGISALSSSFMFISDRLESLIVECDDLGHEMENLNDDVAIDPQRLENIQNELDVIYALMQKFNASGIDELLAIRVATEEKLLKIDSFSTEIIAATNAVASSYEKLLEVMGRLSEKRKKAIPGLTKAVLKNLKAVNLDNATFSIEIKATQEPGRDGGDNVRFLFSANKGVEMNDIQKVASGGELSRLMLSLKAVLTEKETLPTIIFDEIESGVSGIAAGKIADLLGNMGSSMQVIAITHLPQLAAKSQAQYHVYKDNSNNKTYSNIKYLSKEERINELSIMLSDGNISEQAVENAKALLKNN